MDLDLVTECALGYLLALEVLVNHTSNKKMMHPYLVTLFMLAASSSSSSEAATTDLALPPAGRGWGRGRVFVLHKKKKKIQMGWEAYSKWSVPGRTLDALHVIIWSVNARILLDREDRQGWDNARFFSFAINKFRRLDGLFSCRTTSGTPKLQWGQSNKWVYDRHIRGICGCFRRGNRRFFSRHGKWGVFWAWGDSISGLRENLRSQSDGAVHAPKHTPYIGTIEGPHALIDRLHRKNGKKLKR